MNKGAVTAQRFAVFLTDIRTMGLQAAIDKGLRGDYRAIRSTEFPSTTSLPVGPIDAKKLSKEEFAALSSKLLV